MIDMYEYKKLKDKEPSYTCIDIDKVISLVNEIIKDCNKEDYDDVAYNLSNLESELERVREENKQLRNWGNDVLDTLYNLIQKVEELESQQIKEMENA